jgi:CelD/BcsL family acetyltransferase involved in cellulose biosynthesis
MESSMKHKIEIIKSFDTFELLKPYWNNLLCFSDSNTIFLTWEWIFSWAECYLDEKRTLFILTVYKDFELIGIAPWYINHTTYNFLSMRRIEFLGTPEAGSDYLDVIAKRGREREVAASLYQFLFDQGRSFWDCMFLREIPSSSIFLLHFLNQIEVDGKYVEIRHGSFCPIASLPASPEGFLLGTSSNRRKQFTRDWRILNNHDEVEYSSFRVGDCEKTLGEFCSFYQDQNQYYNQPLVKFIKNFASQCNKKDWLQVDLLTSKSRQVASLLHLRYKEELSLFLMTVDKKFNPKISVGNVLVGLAIRGASDQGLNYYDFLKGYEAYKFHWADKGRRSLDILFCRKKLSPMIFLTKRFLKYSAKLVLK